MEQCAYDACWLNKERFMALKDKKLAPDLKANEQVAAAIQPRLEDGLLSCSTSFAIAKELDCAPIAVGQTADVLAIHLTSCQLGLFGYPGHAKGWEDAKVAELPVHTGIEQALRDGRNEQGDINCLVLWRLADQLGVSRIHIGYLADRLGIKIRGCQLGAF
jgi:hypothetical protein